MESYQKAQKQIDDLAAEWQKELDKKVGNIESKVNDLGKNELLLPCLLYTSPSPRDPE